MFFDGATPSVKIRDTATPVNNVDTSLESFDAYNSVLTYTSPSPKNVMQSDGYVKYSAHNFARYSEDATNVVWRFANAGMNSADGDVTTAPDGSATADGFTEDTSTDVHRVYYYDGSTGLVAGLDYRLAFRIKGNGRTKFFIQSPPLGATSTTIDLVAVTSSNSNWSITALPDDWFLVEGTATASASGAFSFYARYDDGSGTTYTGDGTSGMYWWGLQLHRAPADETYLPTTTAARYALPIEYDTSSGAIGVLVEPAATNVFPYSKDFSQADWSKYQSVLTKDQTGIDGVANSAYEFSDDGGGGSSFVRMNETVTVTSGANIFSLIVKKTGTTDYAYLETASFDASSTGHSYFKFSTGVVHSEHANHTAAIADLGNSFYEISIAFTTTTDLAGFLYFGASGGGASASDAPRDGNTTFIVDHAQLETGSKTSSRIITAGSTVTRLVDDIGIATSDFPFNTATGTLYVEGIHKADTGGYYAHLGEGVNTSGMSVTTASSSRGVTTLRNGSAASSTIHINVAAATDWNNDETVNKAFLSHSATDGSAGWNGVEKGSVTAVTVDLTGMTNLNIGQSTAGTLRHNGHIKSIAYIPERITDANLLVMTT